MTNASYIIIILHDKYCNEIMSQQFFFVVVSRWVLSVEWFLFKNFWYESFGNRIFLRHMGAQPFLIFRYKSFSPKLILIKSNALHSFVCHCHKEPFWLIIPNVFNRASVDIYLFKFWFNFWYFNILWDFIACTINKPHQSYKVFFVTTAWHHIPLAEIIGGRI